MFKRRMNLPSTFPSVSLHSPNLFNIIKLSSFLQSEHLSTLYKLLNNSKFSPLYLARLKNLQYTLWLPFSPLSLSNWLPFLNLKQFKDDFLVHILASARSIDIKFSSFNNNLNFSVSGGQLPLIDLIPSTYVLPTTIRSLRSLHLLYLSQLTSSDGTYLLTWKELQYYNIVYAKGRLPHWYTALQQHTCHPRSYRLLPQFVTPAHLSHNLPLPLVTINKRSEEHTSELQSLTNLVCRLLLE